MGIRLEGNKELLGLWVGENEGAKSWLNILGERFPMAAKAWRARWEQVIPLFSYPGPIRKVIYTTNAIESLNSRLRKVTRKRGALPTEESVKKVVYLAMNRVAKRWNRPIKNWPAALNYFSIVFEGRLPA